MTAIGYPGVFLLMAIEGFGVPIPSEVTMPFAGFLTTSYGGSKFLLPLVIGVGTAGEVTGSVVAYAIGFFGGRRVLERYGKWVFVSEKELEKVELWFARYGDWIVPVTRLLPAVRGFIALPAGVARMPFWRFLIYSLAGSAIWCIVLTVIGHLLGQHWQQVDAQARRYNWVVVVLVVAVGAFALYRRRVAGQARRHEGERLTAAE